ncbi:MAG: toxin, partial [bacterium]|nr:toxin [bacterium]
VLRDDLTIDEEREACRALKGSMLRQEVYALDDTDKAEHPYTVTEQNFAIRRLQPRKDNRHAVFFTPAREAINYHYERNPTNPRIAHAMTLEVDDFGNVLKEAAIGYGRRQSDMNLSLEDRTKQAQTLITYTENRVTNAIEATNDDYRTPLPYETCTYELTGFKPENNAARFSFDEWTRNNFALPTSATEIPYEQTADNVSKQKRLIEHVRTLYRPNKMGVDENDPLTLLPPGTLQSLALPGESYSLAFTPELLTNLFGNKVTAVMMNSDGKYVHFGNDNNWWISSGRVFYSADNNDSAQVERDYAENHFFLPHRFLDPFGQTTSIQFDGYDLQTLETTDPLGNKVTAGERDSNNNITSKIDYRVLQPALVTGPNGNRSEVAFDTLGLVAGTAVMGKTGENKGDSLAGFQADLAQNEIDAFFADPKGQIAATLLGGASTRIIYDESRYYRLANVEKPVFAATIARETHASDPLPAQGLKLQTSFSFSDGFGREIQKKIEAEAGPLDLDDPNSPVIDPRWVGSGWTIFNNKGKPVKQYEPFFDDSHDFRFGKQVGVSSTLFYDPVERVVATLHPNHTYEKVVFDPWRQEAWDVNDTVLQADPKSDIDIGGFFERIPDSDYLTSWYESRINGQKGAAEKSAAEKTADHNGTPTVAHFDSLGQPFLTVADNGQKGTYETRVDLDI